jgi:hypothetical protein
MSRSARLLVLVAIGLLAGCSSERGVLSPTGYGASTPVVCADTAGVTSGVLVSGDFTLDVPSGALPSGATVSMQLTQNGKACQLRSTERQFQTASTLAVKKPWPRPEGAVYHLFYLDPTQGTWVDLGGTDEGDRVSGKIIHIGSYEMDEVE